MAEAKATIERPLSPHMFAYRWRINMVMSIAHRLTGDVGHPGRVAPDARRTMRTGKDRP